MRRGAPISVLLIVIAITLGALAAGPAQAATSPYAHGTVTAADGSGPIAGITVCATHRNTSGDYGGERCTETAADGTYRIDVTASLYSFTAEQRYLYGDWLPQDYNARKAYSFGATTSRTFNFSLVRGAKISGYLKAPGGGGPGHDVMAVEAYRVDSTGVTRGYANVFSNVGTSGYFEVSKIPPGRYRLKISDNSGTYAWAEQWYPASGTASGGTLFTVTAGQRITGQDAQLTVPGSITIQLLKPTGSSVGGWIDFYDTDGRLLYNAESNYTSRQTIHGLFPGTYKVRASPLNVAGYREWFTWKRTFATANPITVKAEATTTKTMTFHYGTLKATSRPKIHFETYELTASKGTWTPSASSYRYDWLRDGTIVRKQTAAYWYNPTRADVGHRIKVCVTASRTAWASGRSCSDPSRVIKTY